MISNAKCPPRIVVDEMEWAGTHPSPSIQMELGQELNYFRCEDKARGLRMGYSLRARTG